MSIRRITTDELRRMNGQEALILQGCGGSLQEWVDGINDMLTEDGILLGGTTTARPLSMTASPASYFRSLTMWS